MPFPEGGGGVGYFMYSVINEFDKQYLCGTMSNLTENKRYLIMLKKPFRIIIATIFMYSAYGKTVNPEPTNHFLASLSWFPISLSPIFITVLIICEISLSLLLILPKTQIFGSHISIIMILIFTIALLLQSEITSDVDCGCFGSIGSGLGLEYSIMRNIILMMMLSVTMQTHDKL